MKKVYLVDCEDWGADEYDSFVVIADNEENAIELVKDKFNETQGKLFAHEILLDEEKVLLGSFHLL